MPSSNPETIPVIIDIAWRLAPKSVLDIGAGYGKYGVLFREYLELRQRENGEAESSHDASFNSRLCRIDAVEGFGAYVNDLHRVVYDEVHVMNALEFLGQQWCYDLVFMGDVLEHIDYSLARQEILPELIHRARMGLLVSVPAHVKEQNALFGNQLEVHRSAWSGADFRSLAPYSEVGRKGSHLVAFMSEVPGMCERLQRRGLRRTLGRIRRALVDAW